MLGFIAKLKHTLFYSYLGTIILDKLFFAIMYDIAQDEHCWIY